MPNTELILDYPDFQVWRDDDKYICCEENYITEVRLIGKFICDITNDNKREPDDAIWASLMSCYCCGERIDDDHIYYLYFDVVPKFDIIDEPH